MFNCRYLLHSGQVEAQAALKDVVVLTSSGEDDTDDDFDEDADAVDSSKELKHAEKKNLDSARIVESSGSNLLDSARSSNNDTHSTPAISERSSSPVSSLNTTPVTSRSASPERKTCVLQFTFGSIFRTLIFFLFQSHISSQEG